MELEDFKRHIALHHDLDDKLILKYFKWAESRILTVTGIPKKHIDHFKDYADYEILMFYFVEHFYTNRQLLDYSNVPPTVLPYTVDTSRTSLNLEYMMWLKENES